MERLFRIGSVFLYGLTAAALGVLALAFIGLAIVRVWSGITHAEAAVSAMLEGIGMVIVALAVFDVSKYLIEEELLRERELRSAEEARKTLTKFLTIVIIAVSLESVVFVFQAGKEDMTRLIYPAALLAVVGLLVAVLGLYQRMSRTTEERDRSD
jgi:TctA family transporter